MWDAPQAIVATESKVAKQLYAAWILKDTRLLCVPTREATVLTQSDVAHDKIADVKRHRENQDQQNHTQVHLPVKVAGAETSGRGCHQAGGAATFAPPGRPKGPPLWERRTEHIPSN